MLKYIDATGRNEDEAIASALEQLKLDRDDVSVEILERAKSGFLGIGGNPAKVRVTYEAPDEEIEMEPVVEEEIPAPKAAVETPVVKEEKKEIPAAPVGDAKAEQIAKFLVGLMEHMGVKANPVVECTEEGIYRVDLEGENLGAVIGRRGETLDAIQ